MANDFTDIKLGITKTSDNNIDITGEVMSRTVNVEIQGDVLDLIADKFVGAFGKMQSTKTDANLKEVLTDLAEEEDTKKSTKKGK